MVQRSSQLDHFFEQSLDFRFCTGSNLGSNEINENFSSANHFTEIIHHYVKFRRLQKICSHIQYSGLKIQMNIFSKFPQIFQLYWQIITKPLLSKKCYEWHVYFVYSQFSFKRVSSCSQNCCYNFVIKKKKKS